MRLYWGVPLLGGLLSLGTLESSRGSFSILISESASIWVARTKPRIRCEDDDIIGRVYSGMEPYIHSRCGTCLRACTFRLSSLLETVFGLMAHTQSSDFNRYTLCPAISRQPAFRATVAATALSAAMALAASGTDPGCEHVFSGAYWPTWQFMGLGNHIYVRLQP